jgi:hypothetical protein
MALARPELEVQIPGGRTFHYVLKNWGDLEITERIGIAVLVTLVATKNRAKRSIIKAMLSLIGKR